MPLTVTPLANGERRLLWTTFTPQQMDIDVDHPAGKAYLGAILQVLAANGVSMVRLDAIGYAVKEAGKSGFMMPKTFAFIAAFAAGARALGLEVLLEIHSYYKTQIEIARQVDRVYDFALPPLVLHALAFGTAAPLLAWLAQRPTNAVTVLDTHDGIGIIDIGADAADRQGRPGLVPAAELDRLVEIIHENSRGQSRRATGAAGTLAPLAWRRRQRRTPPLVVLCDISGSMDRYARMLLHFLHAITNDGHRVQTSYDD